MAAAVFFFWKFMLRPWLLFNVLAVHLCPWRDFKIFSFRLCYVGITTGMTLAGHESFWGITSRGRVFCTSPEASVTGFYLAAEKLGGVRDVCIGLWATAFSSLSGEEVVYGNLRTCEGHVRSCVMTDWSQPVLMPYHRCYPDIPVYCPEPMLLDDTMRQ